ncbi:NK-tumor recognition protein isoform X2 [Hylaeus volcanicus]|uniref:NK-tumor recognition protein isoform X2 n=3 Tax=Hylaeus volcanicus TaxID=313075 RepID=UPI0023B7CC44|nr:NK-tumor recognition protein isoform X2 [Hylaeus volcanicus]
MSYAFFYSRRLIIQEIVSFKYLNHIMETGYLNFRDEEHFSDFSLSLDQNLMDKPQDLLMHMVENDFDYMETHLDIANSDSLWSNEQEHIEDVDDVSISESPTISKIDNIKEDFAKVLTDWQEHIGYLQATDMDEYMDVIELNTNTTDRKSFSISENAFQDEKSILTRKSNYLKTNQKNLGKESLRSSQSIQELESRSTDIEDTREQNSYHNKSDIMKSDKKVEGESKSLLKEPKYTNKQNKMECDNIGIDVTANVLVKQKKKKKENLIQRNKNTKNNNFNKKSISNHLPVLEAGTVESLLEQFEASENTAISSHRSTKISTECKQELHMKPTKIQQRMKQSGITIAKKLSQVSNLHKNIRESQPKGVIEKIKTSGRKKVISIIPTMSNRQSSGRSNGTRMQDAAATLSRNKLLKIVTNNTKSKTVDGGLVHLDHDYCSSSNSCSSSSDSNSEYERQSSDSEKVTAFKDNNWQSSHFYTAYLKQTFSSHLNKPIIKRRENSTEDTARKDSDLESSKVNNKEESDVTVSNDVQVSGSVKLQNEIKEEPPTEHENDQNINVSSNTSNCTNQVHNESLNKLTQEIKIRSALATSILQLQKGVLNKTKGNQKTTQMVSVLKKPLNTQLPVVMTTSNESIITISNGSNDKVHNIIVQDTKKAFPKEEERKPRKKLNLAEYRSRREQNRSDNSRTNSPIQPMTLIYVHHASTTTEPIKDDPGTLIWSEREIVSVLKPKADIDEEKLRPKPPTCDVGIQTYETVFEFPPKSLIDVDERHVEERDQHILNTSQRPYTKQRINSRSSRSRSRSKSKSRSRSRSRSRSSSSRSRSRKRSNTRHRRISHRRSSVSSSSTWSSRSRSRSNTRSTFSSGSRYSRSRSRSSRSRSQCSSRYSSCSRSSSHSNFGRSKWSIRRKKERRYRRSYDRQRRHSSSSYRSYKDWRRSPSSSYRKSYDWCDREKQRQVEERRVIYVGRLDEGITKADLRRRFETFGPIVDISIHIREHGDNYGFVTFAYKNDAYEAVEHGNDDRNLPRYDLCFGGRRAFCKVKYADLDGMASSSPNSAHKSQGSEDNTFDLLLQEAKAKLRKRKV